jgi:hypothetical protein
MWLKRHRGSGPPRCTDRPHVFKRAYGLPLGQYRRQTSSRSPSR